MNEKNANTLALALGIALLPAIWAVVSPYIGNTVGAVALICAGIYVSAGSKKLKDAVRICVGFIIGTVWAVLTLKLLEYLPFNPDIEKFVTLFLAGGITVLLGFLLEKFVFLPSWLTGWAIGLALLGPMGTEFGTLPLQLCVSSVVGVIYVGVGIDMFCRHFVRLVMKKQAK